MLDEKELKTIIGYMKVSVNTLDQFTKEMTSLVTEHKQKTSDKKWS
jgi:hypothetical protein